MYLSISVNLVSLILSIAATAPLEDSMDSFVSTVFGRVWGSATVIGVLKLSLSHQIEYQ